MKKSLRFYFLTAAVLLVLVVSAVSPLSALADNSTPAAPTSPPAPNTTDTSSNTSSSTTSNSPASGSAASTSAPADNSPAATSPASTDTAAPANTSAPATPAPSTSTTVPPADTSAPATTAASTDTSTAPQGSSSATPAPSTNTTVAPTDTTAAPTNAAAGNAVTSTLTAVVPTGTPVVVLDATGTVVPLATQEAANILKNGDPIWCPTGQTPGGAGCTASFSAFNGGTGLLSDLQSNPGTFSGNGTIYIAYNYTPSGSDVGGVTLDGNTLQGGGAKGALNDLTLQGGWNFVSNSLNSSQNYTDFGSNPLTVKNWLGNVTINDIYISNVSSGNGLTVLVTSGNIKVHHVHSDNNPLAGAQLDNSPGAGSSITVDGNSEFNGNTGNGITAFPGKNGDVTLTDVVANSNEGNGASISNVYSGATGGDILIDPSSFNSNGQDGLNISAIGDIVLSNVTADGNTSTGANLDNSGTGFGNIDITSSTFDSNLNTGRGLIAHSNHDISLNNVTASDNGGGGAELDNTFGIGSILLTGSNTFNGNGFNLDPSVGLYAISNFDVNLNGVTALGNGYQGSSGFGGGAFFGAGSGDLSITNSVFSTNCTFCSTGFGFVAFTGGDTNLLGVTADKNGKTGSASAIGAIIFDEGGNVSITNSDFSGNCSQGVNCEGGGIEVEDASSGGLVTFDHVTANGNGTISTEGGAFITSPGNVNINCSTFNNNSGLGLAADIASGKTITLNGVSLSGNGMGATDISGGGTLVSNPGNCGSGGGKKGSTGGLPIDIIPVTGSLDCTHFSATEIDLPDQDHILLPCPTTGNAALTGQTGDQLPGKLDAKYTFVSAFNAAVTPNLDGSMTVSFKVPTGQKNANFTILHWDGSKWVEVGGSMTPDGFFQSQTNLTGVYVLVTK